MKATATKDGVTLKLTVEEAIALEAVLGGFTGYVARELPWYDQIADVLEAKHLPSTISYAVEQRFNHFHCAPCFWDGENFAPDNTRQIRKTTASDLADEIEAERDDPTGHRISL